MNPRSTPPRTAGHVRPAAGHVKPPAAANRALPPHPAALSILQPRRRPMRPRSGPRGPSPRAAARLQLRRRDPSPSRLPHRSGRRRAPPRLATFPTAPPSAARRRLAGHRRRSPHRPAPSEELRGRPGATRPDSPFRRSLEFKLASPEFGLVGSVSSGIRSTHSSIQMPRPNPDLVIPLRPIPLTFSERLNFY